MSKRGCGDARTEGGVYIESGLSPFGLPLEHFILDPPERWPGEKLPSLGVKIQKIDGFFHIVDVVGESHYPSPADYLEEGRRMGFSRKVNPGLDFSLLTAGASRIVTLHPKAIVKDWERHASWGQSSYQLDAMGFSDLYEVNPQKCFCPIYKREKDEKHINDAHHFCTGYHWMLWDPDQPVQESESYQAGQRTAPASDFLVNRTIGSTTYKVFRSKIWLDNPEYEVGIIASLPITNIAVIKAKDGSHTETAAKVSEKTKQIPVTIEDE